RTLLVGMTWNLMKGTRNVERRTLRGRRRSEIAHLDFAADVAQAEPEGAGVLLGQHAHAVAEVVPGAADQLPLHLVDGVAVLAAGGDRLQRLADAAGAVLADVAAG